MNLKKAMEPERWRKVEEIFHTALECEYGKRADYLEEACKDDLALRREVESLLATAEEMKSLPFLENASTEKRNLPQRSLDALVGEVIDEKYRIEKLLGQGGMGAVFLATHIGTDRHVAVKVIAPQFMAHKEFVERFRREARAMGRLRHPNVVNVTDFGFASVNSDRIAYLVMEYLDGYTLGEMMKKRGKLPLELVVDIVEQTCLAIKEAHKQGIIHRDLKPDNIWLEPNGRGGYNVKVLDFGLAKLCETSQSIGSPVSFVADSVPNFEASNSDDISTLIAIPSMKREVPVGEIDPQTGPEWLTRTGMVMGTPRYMSPEQCNGNALDARSDIYSLGVIVYEMLAWEPPFSGDIYQLIAKHNEMPPPPLREKRRDIPKATADLVMSALAKSPADRPPSAAAFAIAFRSYAEGEIPILQQANILYGKRYSVFIRCAFLIFIPFLLLCASATLISNWLLLPLLLLLPLADALNVAVCAIITNRLRFASPDRLQIRSVFKELLERAPTIAAASIINVYHSLCVPVIAVEGEQKGFAVARAKTLASKVRSHLRAIRINNILISLTTAVLIMPVMTVIFTLFMSDLVFDAAAISDPFLLIRYISFFMAAELFFLAAGFGRFSSSIALVLLYFKSRRMGGELLDEAFDETYALEYPAPSFKRSLGFIGSVLAKRTLTTLGVVLFLVLSNFLPLMFFTADKMKMELPILAGTGSPERVKEALASGADVNGKDGIGRTALMAAAEDGYVEIVKELLAAGADINAADRNGDTALIRAAEAGRTDVVKELISSGADLHLQNKIGRTALSLAMDKRRSDIAELLRKAGAED